MKRLFALILALLMVLSLFAGCGGGGNEQKETRRFYDLERNALTQIDPENIYVGFYAARNAKSI